MLGEKCDAAQASHCIDQRVTEMSPVRRNRHHSPHIYTHTAERARAGDPGNDGFQPGCIFQSMGGLPICKRRPVIMNCTANQQCTFGAPQRPRGVSELLRVSTYLFAACPMANSIHHRLVACRQIFHQLGKQEESRELVRTGDRRQGTEQGTGDRGQGTGSPGPFDAAGCRWRLLPPLLGLASFREVMVIRGHVVGNVGNHAM